MIDDTLIIYIKPEHLLYDLIPWLRGPDLNRRPSGYEPDELPLLHPATIGQVAKYDV